MVEVERGGDVTYHGPGQVVAYPILLLGEGERDLHRFLRNLEEAMIRTLAGFGIEAGREPGKTGVWWSASGARKIASIGIACRKWVTFHGLALNVTTDLAYFARIQPCGFDARVMTSMAAELGRDVALAPSRRRWPSDLGATLGRDFAAPDRVATSERGVRARATGREGREEAGLANFRVCAAPHRVTRMIAALASVDTLSGECPLLLATPLVRSTIGGPSPRSEL